MAKNNKNTGSKKGVLETTTYKKAMGLIGDSLPGSIMGKYFDGDFPVYFISQQMLMLLGYTYEEFQVVAKGKISSFFHLEDKKSTIEKMNIQLKERGEYEVTYRMIRKDATIVWVLDKGRYIQDDEGRENIASICIDITKQKDLETKMEQQKKLLERKKEQLNLYEKVSPGGIFRIRLDDYFTILYGNEMYYYILGYTKEQMVQEINHQAIHYIHPDDLMEVRKKFEDALAKGNASCSVEMRIITRSGKVKWMLTGGNFIQDSKGTIVFGVLIDCTPMKEMELELKRLEECYRLGLSQVKIGVWEYDILRKRIIQTASSKRLHGVEDIIENIPESILNQDFLCEESRKEYQEMYQCVVEGKQKASSTIKIKLKNGGYAWERIRYTTIFDKTGRPIRAIGISEDVTAQSEIEKKYWREVQYREAVTPDMLASYRVNLSKASMEDVKSQEKKILKKKNEVTTYMDFLEAAAHKIVRKTAKQQYYDTFCRETLLEKYRKGITSASLEYQREGEDGEILWVCTNINLLEEPESGAIYGFVYVRNIDEKKKLELTLIAMAKRDAMTHLYNKTTTEAMVQEALESHRGDEQCAMLMIDLDNFKRVNDTFGHMYGDKVLVELGRILKASFESRDIIGRVGGDEFMVFVESIPSEAWMKKKAELLCEKMHEASTKGEYGYRVSGSVGIALSTYKKAKFRELYQEADSALYDAKQRGKNCYSFYTQRIKERECESQNTDVISNNVLLACTLALLSPTSLEDAMGQVLKSIGDFYQADRAYLFEFDLETKEAKSAYEWCASGVKSKMQTRKHASIPIFPRWLSAFSKKEDIILHSLDEIKENHKEEYLRLKAQDIRTLYAVPFFTNEKPSGYIGVDNPGFHFDHLAILDSLSEFIMNEINRRRLEKRQEYLSCHDEMTGLPNRNGYAKFLQAKKEESLSSLGVVSTDINGLKQFNEKFGHTYGDEMLKCVAAVLVEQFGANHVYRFEGDDFLAFCQDVTKESFTNRVELVKTNVNKKLGDCISIGATFADADVHIHSLCRHAEELLVIAKQEYYKTVHSVSKYNASTMREDLLKEIKAGKFKMYLQPKADIQTGRVKGAEALVRYCSLEYGIVSPGKFVPLLEKANLIAYIDFFMLEETCKTLERWKKKGYLLFPISVNFSRITLLDPNLIEKILQICNKYEVERNLIEIEITESIGDMENGTVSEINDKIRKENFRISLDDFGSKYTSMSILSVMEFEVLKLDKTLVDELVTNEKGRIMVKRILQMCRDMGIETVAEGVETIEQLAILKGLDCDFAQGYLYNKPIPRDTFEKNYLD